MSKKVEVVVRGKAYSHIENGRPKTVPVGSNTVVSVAFYEANKDRFEMVEGASKARRSNPKNAGTERAESSE